MARPREFDEFEVLDGALELFWTTGFRAASLDALEEATGLNRSSLYNAFGGKRALFCRVLDHYSAGPCVQMHQPLTSKHGADALRAYLQGLTRFVRSPIGERGCLMVKTAAERDGDREIESRIERHFTSQTKLLRVRAVEAIAAGEMTTALGANDVALMLATLSRGVLAGAASGVAASASKTAVKATIELLELS